MPATTFERTPRHLRSYSIDHWCFVCARSGTAEVVGAQRTCVTMPGTAKIISLRGMFQGSITPMNALCVFVPRDLCRDVAGALDAADNTNLTSGLGRLLADYLLDLDRRMSMITTAEVPNILAATSAMITACVSPSADRLAEAQTPIDMTLLERARNLIQHNLFSPNFGAEELCHSLGVSRSRLYRLFEPLGGVVTYIRTQRLLDAHAALSDSEDLRPIIEIAAERGFVDPAEFSRAFRREFGYRPKDARGLAFGWPMRRELNAEPKDGRQRLGDILRRLQ